MKKLLISTAIAATSILTGCAANPDKLAASHISTYQYAEYSCEQLSHELEVVSAKGQTIYKQLKRERTKDIAATTVGLVIFWPALFLTAGDEDVQEIEYSRLKGQADALNTTMRMKSCATQV